MKMKKIILAFLVLIWVQMAVGQNQLSPDKDFSIKGFHLDLRIQVMTMGALKDFAKKLSLSGVNTLIMEWEGTYPFEKHPLIPNKNAYSVAAIRSFIKY